MKVATTVEGKVMLHEQATHIVPSLNAALIKDDPEEQKINKEEINSEDLILFIRHRDGSLTFSTLYKYIAVMPGDELVVLAKQ